MFLAPEQISFWMHNTDIALDIGYFDVDGNLKEVYPMVLAQRTLAVVAPGRSEVRTRDEPRLLQEQRRHSWSET